MAIKDQTDPHLFISEMNENDTEKMKMLLRSFSTAEDLAEFIKSARELRKESERRAWAWGVVKKTATAITLLGGAITVLWNAYVSWKGAGS